MSPLRNKALTAALAALAAIATLSLIASPTWNRVSAQSRLTDGLPSVVFVSRGIPRVGSVFWDVPNDMPGVGPYSRFRVAAPGRLSVLEPDGSLRVLVNGSNPSAASLNLIDVNAPDVSYDGSKIVFAGFSSEEFNAGLDTQPLRNPDAWRLYVINADGSGLRQLTFSDQDHLDYSQFGQTASTALPGYDDTDPAWLPDGRIVFSSTRWPAFGQYSAARTTNLHVINADGSGLHRITAEKSGADRPLVDPVTGKIVFSRWWRNQRFATNNMATIRNNDYPCCDGYDYKDGLTRDRDNQLGGGDFLNRNQWHAAFINPDGTELAQFAGPHQSSDGVHVYGGGFGASGELVANYFPMTNMTEAAGFGGLRRYRRGVVEYEPIIGITSRYGGAPRVSENPPSFGILQGNYAGEPAVLPDGRIVISWAADVAQDYGLYVIDRNGGNRTLLFDRSGTTELRARLLQARPVPPIIADAVNPNASLLPPREEGPYDIDGTFVFNALNVYGNGPVDSIEASAPKVGSADKIRFFADFQRINWGSLETLDWPILLGEQQVNPDGSVREASAPANIPLFEQLRSADGTVPFTMGEPAGAAHVAGMNYGKPGAEARCIGCHSGHTMIPVPESDEAAKWSNLAPGAEVSVSSTRYAPSNNGLVDRRVMKGDIFDYWSSAPGSVAGQWVELVFPEPVSVRTVRLYNPRFTSGSTLRVHDATVRLGLPGSTQWAASESTGELSVSGSDVNFPDVRAQTVRVEIGAVSGRSYDGLDVASLAEVEVIARAGDGTSPGNARPTVIISAPTDGASVEEGTSLSFRGSASDAEDGDLSNRINWTSSRDGALGAGAAIGKTLTVGAHTITARATDDGGLTGSSSISVTVTQTPGGNGSPTLTITSPANATSVAEGTRLTFAGTATDGNGEDMSGRIFWSSNVDGGLGTGVSVPAVLSLGTHSIRASFVDNAGQRTSRWIDVTVTSGSGGNTAPTVTITSPANGASVEEGTSLSFSGSASDTEDGDISNRVNWTSNRDGALAAGAAIGKTLSVGLHTITAQATDDGGLTGSSSINVTVTAKPGGNGTPTLTINSPANGTSVAEGTRLVLQGTATDGNGEDMSGRIFWSSNVDGGLGTGASVSALLSVGIHSIRASFVDNAGRRTSRWIEVTVGPQPGANTAPTLTITSPANGTSVKQGTSLTLQGTATDTQDGNLSGRIFWSSDRDGALGTGVSVPALLSLGTHRIRASLVDNGGLRTSRWLTVTVTP